MPQKLISNRPFSSVAQRMVDLIGYRFYDQHNREIPKYKIAHSKLKIDFVLSGKAGIRVENRPRYVPEKP